MMLADRLLPCSRQKIADRAGFAEPVVNTNQEDGMQQPSENAEEYHDRELLFKYVEGALDDIPEKREELFRRRLLGRLAAAVFRWLADSLRWGGLALLGWGALLRRGGHRRLFPGAAVPFQPAAIRRVNLVPVAVRCLQAQLGDILPELCFGNAARCPSPVSG